LNGLRKINNRRCPISEFHSVRCQLRTQYESSLLEGLKKIGYSPKVYDKAHSLFGYTGSERPQKAHIVIPRGQVGVASNDIGFLREEDGFYTIHVSEYDKEKWNKKFPELVKHYALDVVNKLVQSGPYQWESQDIDKNGVTTIRLLVRD